MFKPSGQLGARIGRALFALGLVIALGLLAACDLATTTPAQAAAAATLDAKILLTDAPENGTVYANLNLALDGNVITGFAHGETATCNGVQLQGSVLGFQGRVPVQPNGGAYVFVYDSGSAKTTVSVPARRGKLLTPLPGATLSRLTALVMTYEPAQAMTSVSGYASMSSSSPDGPSQTNNGIYTLNASALQSLTAGSGWVGLHWKDSSNGTVSGPAFKSLSTTYDSYASEQVTWA